MSFDEPDYICRECHGRKIIDAHSIILGRVCPTCNGRGRSDWIVHAMGTRNPYETPDDQFLHNLIMKNIQMLIHEIHIQALELGITADVSVEFRNGDRFRYGPGDITFDGLINTKIKSP